MDKSLSFHKNTIWHAIAFSALFGGVMSGCKSPTNEQEGARSITVETTRFASVDSFFTNCRYVILQSTDEAIIGRDAMYRTSEKYIATYSRSNGFKVFSMDGNLISTFNHYGDGPGEYVDITDIYVQEDNVLAIDWIKKRILRYDVFTGELKHEMSLPDSYLYFAPIGESYIALCSAYNNTSMNNFAILETKTNKIVETFLPYGKIQSTIFGDFTAFVAEGKDCVYGVLPFSHKLYCISSTDCSPLYDYNIITADEFIVSENDANISELWDEYRLKRVVKWLGPYAETAIGSHYQSFSLFCEYGILPFICKFSDGDNQAITLRIGAERFEQFPYLTTEPVEFSCGNYVCVVPADNILHSELIIGEDTFSSQGVTEDSNPVVFFYQFM